MKNIDVAAAVLLVVGGLNWGLIGLGGPDLVAALLGQGSWASRLVYGLVGVSAVWQALQWKGIQRRWLPRPQAVLPVIGLALLAAAPLMAQQPVETGMAKPGTVVETAVAAGQFKTLATALETAGLVETLQGKGPFTVFAPTDAAFAKLPKGTLDGLLADKAKLTKVLTYHVVAGGPDPVVDGSWGSQRGRHRRDATDAGRARPRDGDKLSPAQLPRPLLCSGWCEWRR